MNVDCPGSGGPCGAGRLKVDCPGSGGPSAGFGAVNVDCPGSGGSSPIGPAPWFGFVQIVPSHGTIEPSPLGLGIIATVELTGGGTTTVVVVPPGSVVTVAVGAGCAGTFVVVEMMTVVCGLSDDPEQPDRSITNVAVANAAAMCRADGNSISHTLAELCWWSCLFSDINGPVAVEPIVVTSAEAFTKAPMVLRNVCR